MLNKKFTPAQANKTLPLVKRIVSDILEKGNEIRTIAQQGDTSAVEQIEKKRKEIFEIMQELEEIGCSYKDWNFNIGLVDFPAEIDGRDVLLCWKSDEEKIAWYHDLETGFAGRTPIPQHLLNEDSAAVDTK